MANASILSILLISCHASRHLAVTGFANQSPPPAPCRAKKLGSFGPRCHCHHRERWHTRRRRQSRDPLSGGTNSRGGSVARAVMSDTTMGEVASENGPSEYIWDVYVSQPSKTSKEKGSVPSLSSIIQAFVSLAPSSDAVRVHHAVFHKQNKQKGKGLIVRCIQRKASTDGSDEDGEVSSALEVGNVDSVDKVYRIMTEHMKLGEINPKAFECMRCYFEGNQRLEQGEPSQAISLYDQSLSVASSQPSLHLPKGTILMKRARAYLKRASKHRKILQMHVKDLTDTVPSASTMKILYQTASAHTALSPFIFDRLAGDTKVQQAKFRQIRYRHDMYEFALLHAVQDGLQATQILPENARAWFLAGECLAELRKLKESDQYYQRALEIDPSMEGTLRGVMEKNRVSQEFMDAARASGFSGDTLRLALDVAA